ncbi:18884_t:CDS:2 [Funneliformis geosporum]|uniref:17885_t:CDS:1 n=1 Tax=Funneliformis geosporum TaxID=1117311 RepID=A0A9W4SRE7_9GLOM|nr:18884_t:CDS:2 [Funneliformis geosporum]CAI2178518.1 17885_t:CDS:2 [Funneliformis geosporum]
MDDITYHLENSAQFWEKLDEILARGVENQASALCSIDLYIKFVSSFQDEFLENEMELMDCCYKLLVSPIYQSFSDVVIDRVIQRASKQTDVKELFLLYNILFLAGKESKKIFAKMMCVREQNFVSKLKNHIYMNKVDNRLQQISIQLLFEICYVQRLTPSELNLIDESFLNYLLDMVENTRNDDDEMFNYSIIRLILSFNEQFLLTCSQIEDVDWNPNTVLRVLGARIGSSKTFGENLIFMLNRAVDHHIQMLILKLLYVLFNTPETFEFFYTNDLRVLIDVFIRELYDMPEESETLRHAFLRVLCPLITNTQLFQYRYKHQQIHNLLLDLNGSTTKQFKPVSPKTQSLVNKCLKADYFGNGITRNPTPNALVSGMDITVNTNSSNGNGLTVN